MPSKMNFKRNLLANKETADLHSAVSLSFLKLKHRAGCLRPAVLGHVFTVKFRLSGFQKAEIIACYQIGINPVIRCIMPQNILRPNGFQ